MMIIIANRASHVHFGDIIHLLYISQFPATHCYEQHIFKELPPREKVKTLINFVISFVIIVSTADEVFSAS